MYVVILPDDCIVDRTLKGINKKLSAEFVESNFHSLGLNKVCDCRKDDFEFVQDLKLMGSIPMKVLYKKDNMLLYLMIVNLIFTFILFATKGGG